MVTLSMLTLDQTREIRTCSFAAPFRSECCKITAHPLCGSVFD